MLEIEINILTELVYFIVKIENTKKISLKLSKKWSRYDY